MYVCAICMCAHMYIYIYIARYFLSTQKHQIRDILSNDSNCTHTIKHQIKENTINKKQEEKYSAFSFIKKKTGFIHSDLPTMVV